MIRKFFSFFLLFVSIALPAQERVVDTTLDGGKKLSVGHEMSLIIASKIALPRIEPEVPEPSKWSGGTLLQLGFSQLALSSWASGGYDNIALNAYVNIYRNYAVLDDMFWENRLQIAYGFIQSFGDRYKKSDDKFIFDSKLGYRAINNFFAAATFNFRTQMTNGFTFPANKEPVLVSSPFAPAYFSLGIGMDYKPVKPLSLNFSPLTGNLVIVDKRELRTRYGNKIDQAAKIELGAQFKVDYKHQINSKLNITSTLNLFSDYLGKPANIKVHWDLLMDSKINKYFSASIRTKLIYDDEILIADKEGHMAPRIQLKEILQIGFSYTFGDFKK
ncbi:hypothetical protein SDC9_62264 [bioreactor metagenome]|uniref:DUF3078 domain-containing protein n=1 Tax=bioreactor metagenome TaxID=1076179 RepID=A0A644XI42_9ZZZZ